MLHRNHEYLLDTTATVTGLALSVEQPRTFQHTAVQVEEGRYRRWTVSLRLYQEA